MLSRRALLLLAGTAVTVSAWLLPEHAFATSNAPGYSRPTVIAVDPSPFSAVPETDSQPTTDLAWTDHSVEEAREFTEAAMASETAAGRSGKAATHSNTVTPEPKDLPSNAKVPEPTALVLLGTALVGVAHAARKSTRS